MKENVMLAHHVRFPSSIRLLGPPSFSSASANPDAPPPRRRLSSFGPAELWCNERRGGSALLLAVWCRDETTSLFPSRRIKRNTALDALFDPS
eukprot:1561280-Rhodomonas_salina.2